MGELPRGVYYVKARDRYKGRIMFEGKTYRSPSFMTAEEAGEWYKSKSFELYGYEHIPVLDEELAHKKEQP